MSFISGALLAMLLIAAAPVAAQFSTRSVQTFGQVSTTADSIRVPVDGPAQPADVGGGAFTIEQWLRCTDGDNEPIGSDYRATDTQASSFDWINGRIFLDRDINGTPPSGGGDWGASLHRPAAGSSASVVRWGAQNSSGTALTIQGSVDVCDDSWHHVAVGRSGASQLFIIVDGVTDFTSADSIAGSLAYPNGTGTGEDRFLVWGNEKHAFQPGYRGYLDELRVWSMARTAQEVSAARFSALDGETLGLELYLQLEEGSGQTLADTTDKNDGALLYDGAWATSVPGGGGSTTTSTTSSTSSSSAPGPTTSSSASSTSSSSSSTSSTFQPPSTTSTTTSPSMPSTSSTTAPGPGPSTTSTTPQQGCTGVADCDDLDPCTTDACVAARCRQDLAGVPGATCELRRFVDAALCPHHPPRAKLERSVVRRIATAARLLDAAAAAGLDRARGRRKTAAALGKLAAAERRIKNAAEELRLADECGATILTALARARAALVPVGSTRDAP